MSWVRLSGQLSMSPLVQNLERRFGLVGYARLVKMLELLAASDIAAGGVVPLPKSDWLDALQVSADELHAFLCFLSKAGWLTYSEGDEPGAPLVVDFLKADDFLPEPVPILFAGANQWIFWCETELNMRREVTGTADSQGLFRRWCATNVTLDEMNAAIELAVKAGTALTPTNLHTLLMTVRKEKLEVARR